MEESYESDTLAVEESHWWYHGRRRIVMDLVARLPLPREAQILDAGCGSGRNLVELAGFGSATGLEPSARGAEVARARGVGEVVEAGIDTMPFDDASFDLITLLDVLEHIEDDRGALQGLRRVARPGGMLLITVPAYPRLWSSHDELNLHTAATPAARFWTAPGRRAGARSGPPTSTRCCSRSRRPGVSVSASGRARSRRRPSSCAHRPRSTGCSSSRCVPRRRCSAAAAGSRPGSRSWGSSQRGSGQGMRRGQEPTVIGGGAR